MTAIFKSIAKGTEVPPCAECDEIATWAMHIDDGETYYYCDRCKKVAEQKQYVEED